MKKSILLGAFGLMISLSASAFQEMKDVQIEVVLVSENIYMLMGGGGNIGVSVGEDGVFMIDDKYAPMSSKIAEAVKTISDHPVKFLVNTHHHGDHTGGNTAFEEQGALIFAHENVRKRLAANEKNTHQSGLPIITFDHKIPTHQISGGNMRAFKGEEYIEPLKLEQLMLND